ncbi:MAG: hypothetical protein FWF61_00305, partial [Brevinematales bacterium]|nr:hypothetical protein [Brevinematales bacterium]
MLDFVYSKFKKASPLLIHFHKKPIHKVICKPKPEITVGTQENTGQEFLTDPAFSDPAISKLLEYAKQKKTLSYEELS